MIVTVLMYVFKLITVAKMTIILMLKIEDNIELN